MKIISKYVNFVILHVANIIICMLLVYAKILVDGIHTRLM